MFGKREKDLMEWKIRFDNWEAIEILRGMHSRVAKELCYLIDRANDEQYEALCNILHTYLYKESKELISRLKEPRFDYELGEDDDQKTLRKSESLKFDVPAEICETIHRKYEEMKYRNLEPIRNPDWQAKQAKKQQKQDERDKAKQLNDDISRLF